MSKNPGRKYSKDGVIDIYVYWVCDKAGCGKQNNRRISKYDRTLVKGSCPILNTDDTCDSCGKIVHEPIFIEVDPFQDKL